MNTKITKSDIEISNNYLNSEDSIDMETKNVPLENLISILTELHCS